jgi:endonuclease III related protein
MIISLKYLYDLLLESFGHQHWWPADRKYHQRNGSDPRFEIMIGAILTQNTAWRNVEKALENLKKQHIFTIHAMTQVQEKTLKSLIQPSGFFNQKAQRLKIFASYLEKTYEGNLNRFFSRDTYEIRHELLSLKGIGLETADSILLYAGDHPVFVVDAYTRRICQRLPLPVRYDSYDDVQRFFENELALALPKKELVSVYKEFHALLVQLAKQYCSKKKPHCSTCPVNQLCKKLL